MRVSVWPLHHWLSFGLVPVPTASVLVDHFALEAARWKLAQPRNIRAFAQRLQPSFGPIKR